MNQWGIQVVAVDFDGTLCESAFPGIGRPCYKARRILNEFRRRGGTVVIWTCREGEHLQAAKDWLDKHGFQYDYLNENPPFRVDQFGWDCRKVGADLYIDDKAPEAMLRGEVDWTTVAILLLAETD